MVQSPMPRARVKLVMMAETGSLRSERTPRRRSYQTGLMRAPSRGMPVLRRGSAGVSIRNDGGGRRYLSASTDSMERRTPHAEDHPVPPVRRQVRRGDELLRVGLQELEDRERAAIPRG